MESGDTLNACVLDVLLAVSLRAPGSFVLAAKWDTSPEGLLSRHSGGVDESQQGIPHVCFSESI